MTQIKIQYLLFLVSLLLYSCNQKEASASITPSPKPGKETKAKTIQKIYSAQDLLALYDSVPAFPLEVSTTIGDEDPESAAFLYKGKEIPRALSIMFDSLLYSREDRPYKGEVIEHTEIYATKRFHISPTTVALLTRVPGDYWSSKMMLFHFDLPTGTVTQKYEIAETWGDAGDSYIKKSIISKTKNNQHRISIEVSECHPLDENLKNFSCVDSLLEGTISEQKIAFYKRKRLKVSNGK
ncbi:hypothetical protein EFA69_01100 [Rufibacter immobilis]|uniref:Lipoprotein n=1 Tax=Rufibacter immobilis TaxID=1348778 RepID=A0A3M9N5G9_9BACT|nr:hypothetical protein [Rufibacter immobilis]RNI33050.1 hypothetical protein EFA69_01100 [Rufibacter immobilis]